MPEIKVLDSEVVRLIAAGEVVERPSSVVKELTENALDAGAAKISVDITRGGLERIRVTDDGCGMSEENAEKAFLKHATSKISTPQDLERIRTLGFRGEALAAISSVSRVTLLTKRAEDAVGHKMMLTGGKVDSREECGCPDGSSFTVQDLFYNTPARLKFMKSEAAEAGAISYILERLALSHPEVSFRFSVNGTEKLHTPGGGDLRQAIFSVFGREFAEMLLPADETVGDVRVHGFVGKPVYTKANRGRQVFFLNGRYVRSSVFTSGFENAYHNKMLIGRMPVCVLFVDLPEDKADINVHPGKLEVKFADENSVAYAVRKATEAALAADTGIVPIRLPETAPEPPVNPFLKPPAPSAFRSAEQKTSVASRPIQRVPEREKAGWTISVPAETPSGKLILNDIVAPAADKVKVLRNEPVPPAPARMPDPPLFETAPSFRLIGEAFGCYAIVERGDEILFIDKHALHERMNFERLRKSEITAQVLLQPLILNFGGEENRVLIENADLLSRFGFLLETFGDDLLVREIPSLIDADQAEPLLQEFLDAFSLRRENTLLDRLYYDIACKASIRSGSDTSLAELEDLIGGYFRRADELQYCPHGRPIVFSLPRHSIEKQFKRVK